MENRAWVASKLTILSARVNLVTQGKSAYSAGLGGQRAAKGHKLQDHSKKSLGPRIPLC